jgi:hypothetical protein
MNDVLRKLPVCARARSEGLAGDFFDRVPLRRNRGRLWRKVGDTTLNCVPDSGDCCFPVRELLDCLQVVEKALGARSRSTLVRGAIPTLCTVYRKVRGDITLLADLVRNPAHLSNLGD